MILEDSSKSGFGGGQKVTLSVMEALQADFDVVLCDTRMETRFKMLATPYAGEFVALASHGRIGNRAVTSFNLSAREVLASPFYLWRNLCILAKAVKRYPDRKIILYATTKKTLIYAYFLHRRYGLPYLFHVHSYFGKSGLGALLDPMLSGARRLICVSAFLQQAVSSPHAIILYNATDIPEQQRVRSLEGKPVIKVGVFAKLLKWKGIDFFLESHSYLRNPDSVIYYVYGDGPEYAHLKAFESVSVLLRGFSSDPVAAMDEMDIIVVPSVAEESFGMTAIEAFALGIPVISTDIGGQAEIVREGLVGWHVPVRNSRAIAACIDEILDSPRQYEQFSRNTVEYMDHFSQTSFKMSVQEVFKSV